MPLPLHLVVGARPNFIKLAPLAHALRARGDIPFQIIHTGQHYDERLSDVFFGALDIPAPAHNLAVGSGSHGAQTARILERYEELLLKNPARGVIVFGDVNSTVACSLAAVKLHIPVVHVEAGLRSFDRKMPEEINRILTDSISDLLLVSELSGLVNLSREGIDPAKMHLVGNIMIDSLALMLPQALRQNALEQLGLEPQGYALLTMHRPSNVDDPDILSRLLHLFAELSCQLPVIFPAHPRTRKLISSLGFPFEAWPSLRLVEPVGYLESLALQKQARVLLTDSGGMQEESAYLGVPCLTLRENTERPITVTHGTSTLVGNDSLKIREAFEQALSGAYKQPQPIPYWDGKTAGRITNILAQYFPAN
jgi:UDP-N-acetylglucosamine 2-epimerase (non-hydrolysing)